MLVATTHSQSLLPIELDKLVSNLDERELQGSGVGVFKKKESIIVYTCKFYSTTKLPAWTIKPTVERHASNNDVNDVVVDRTPSRAVEEQNLDVTHSRVWLRFTWQCEDLDQELCRSSLDDSSA